METLFFFFSFSICGLVLISAQKRLTPEEKAVWLGLKF